MRDQRTRSTLATAAIVDAMATGVELARVRISTIVVASSSTSLKTTLKGLLCMEALGRTTMLVLVVSRPVPRVVAEEAAGRRGEPSGDVVPRQTVEAETDERRRHWPVATRVRRALRRPRRCRRL